MMYKPSLYHDLLVTKSPHSLTIPPKPHSITSIHPQLLQLRYIPPTQPITDPSNYRKSTLYQHNLTKSCLFTCTTHPYPPLVPRPYHKHQSKLPTFFPKKYIIKQNINTHLKEQTQLRTILHFQPPRINPTSNKQTYIPNYHTPPTKLPYQINNQIIQLYYIYTSPQTYTNHNSSLGMLLE